MPRDFSVSSHSRGGCEKTEQEVAEARANLATPQTELKPELAQLYDERGWKAAQAAGDDGDGRYEFAPSAARVVEATSEPPNRPEPPARPEREEWDSERHVLEKAAELPAEKEIPLLVTLDVDDPDRMPLAGVEATADPRETEIARRKANMEPHAGAIETWLEERGGKLTYAGWLAPRVDVILPAGKVPELLRHPLVDGAYEPPEWQPHYDGLERHEALRREDFIDEGFTGFNKYIGFYEVTEIYADHDGWNLWFCFFDCGWISRLTTYLCDGDGCGEYESEHDEGSHATNVGWSIGGSIEDGQDSDFPGSFTDDQTTRSGTAPEAMLDFYYQDSDQYAPPMDGDSFQAALEHAIDKGLVGVFNLSNGIHAPFNDPCDPDLNYADLNSVLENALDDGILITDSAANDDYGDTGECTLQYPAQRSETITVGALADEQPYEDSTRWTVPDDDSWGSSVGPVDIETRNGFSTVTPGVDLAAPGCIHKYFDPHPLGISPPYSPNPTCGTSYSAPTVAGGITLLREVFADKGWDTTAENARLLMANVFLMGDASDMTEDGLAQEHVDYKSGYGRMRLMAPESWSLQSPWRWMTRIRTVETNTTTSFEVWENDEAPSGLTQFQVAMSWVEPDLLDTSDVVLQVVDTCPDGGGEEILGSDWPWGLRKRVDLREDIEGRCIEVRATAYEAPSSGQTVYFGVMAHSGDPM